MTVHASRVVGILDLQTLASHACSFDRAIMRAYGLGLRTFLLRAVGVSPSEQRAVWRWLEGETPPGLRVLQHASAVLPKGVRIDGRHFPSHHLRGEGAAYCEGRVGYSTHDAWELKRAEMLGAQWAFVSPFMPSASKPGYGPCLGLEGVRSLAQSTTVPVFALAGVDATTIKGLGAAGAAGVAVMGMLGHPEKEEELKQLLKAMEDELWCVQTPW